MRKALEFPRIDEGKLDAVEALIAAIADKEPGTAGAELEDLAALTGKVHTDVEFAEYWSWTALDTLARLTGAGTALYPRPVPGGTGRACGNHPALLCHRPGMGDALLHGAAAPLPLPAQCHGLCGLR